VLQKKKFKNGEISVNGVFFYNLHVGLSFVQWNEDVTHQGTEMPSWWALGPNTGTEPLVRSLGYCYTHQRNYWYTQQFCIFLILPFHKRIRISWSVWVDLWASYGSETYGSVDSYKPNLKVFFKIFFSKDHNALTNQANKPIIL